MRRLAATLTAGALALAPTADAGRAGLIREYPLAAHAGIYLFGIVSGPGGAIWFVDQGRLVGGRCLIGRLDPRRLRLRVYTRGLRRGSLPYAIAAGPGGEMWFTDEGRTPAIGRITPGGAVGESAAGLTAGSQPVAITLGPDGRMWFTDLAGQPALGSVQTR